MDRALLERMTGAVVLVALCVWLAPALLDGRDDSRAGGTVNDPEAGSRSGLRTVVIERAGSSVAVPSQPAESRSTATPAEPAVAVSRAAAPVRAAAEPGGSKPLDDAPSKGFAVQLGSFSSRDNAVSYARTLRKSGYAIFVVKAQAGSQSVYRVYAGPESSRGSAETLAARLKSDGQSVMVVDLAGG